MPDPSAARGLEDPVGISGTTDTSQVSEDSHPSGCPCGVHHPKGPKRHSLRYQRDRASVGDEVYEGVAAGRYREVAPRQWVDEVYGNCTSPMRIRTGSSEADTTGTHARRSTAWRVTSARLDHDQATPVFRGRPQDPRTLSFTQNRVGIIRERIKK